MQGCQCTTLFPQLLLLASKIARRSAISAARCATARRLSSGVNLVSPRGCRTKGMPMAKGGVVTGLYHPHARYVPCPEQRATREVVLEREDPGALLWAPGGDAVY